MNNKIINIYEKFITQPILLALITVFISVLFSSELYGVTIFREILALLLVFVFYTIHTKNKPDKKFQILFIISYVVFFMLRDLLAVVVSLFESEFWQAELAYGFMRILIVSCFKLFMRIIYATFILNIVNYIVIKLINTKLCRNFISQKSTKIIILLFLLLSFVIAMPELSIKKINGTFSKLTTVKLEYRINDREVILPDNSIFFASLEPNKEISFFIYDPFNMKLKRQGKFNLQYSDMQIFPLKNGDVFIIGANYKKENGNKNLKAVLYSPQNNTTKYTPRIPYPCYVSSILELPNQKLLITGGEGRSKNAQMYDIKNNKFYKLSDMNEGRFSHASILMKNNKVLILGGETKNAEIYDINADKFTSVDIGFETDYSEKNKLFLLDDGKIFVYCVRNYLEYNKDFDVIHTDYNGKTTYPFSYIGLLDTSTYKMEDLSISKKYKIQDFEVTQLKDGRILITGGKIGRGTNQGYKILDTAYIYNPKTKNFDKVRNKMLTARSGHSSALLNDGRVLIWGGMNNNTIYVDSMEIFEE